MNTYVSSENIWVFPCANRLEKNIGAKLNTEENLVNLSGSAGRKSYIVKQEGNFLYFVLGGYSIKVSESAIGREEGEKVYVILKTKQVDLVTEESNSEKTTIIKNQKTDSNTALDEYVDNNWKFCGISFSNSKPTNLTDTYCLQLYNTDGQLIDANRRAISEDEIATDAITTDKLKAVAVTADKLANNAVTTDKLNNNAVITDKINNKAITTEKINTKAITAEKIADKTITNAQLADKTITANQITDNTITATQVANNTITAEKIANKTITNNEIADNTITATQLGDIVDKEGGTANGITVTLTQENSKGAISATVSSTKVTNAENADNATSADKVKNKLTLASDKTFDGSSALDFKFDKSKAISSDNNGYLTSTDLTTATPTASGTSQTFISNISQNAVGKITATKANVPAGETKFKGSTGDAISVFKANQTTNTTLNIKATVNNTIGTPTVAVNTSNSDMTFAFSNLKGEKGDKGETGTLPNFGDASTISYKTDTGIQRGRRFFVQTDEPIANMQTGDIWIKY